ncbi:hypothetical protein [Nocardia cyriacigeorgica]|uniref:hypothetical protein n=1 Tax=Nocardia cyriacigeorgica TaxID=135487 RepID=UPI002456127A|nr:hypothetical protein [Nocardia cyriacigeorgica]
MFNRAYTATLVAVIAALLVSCSGLDPIRDGLGIGGPACVDAAGDNSSVEDLADALMRASFTDPRTGQRTSLEQQAREMVADGGGALGLSLPIDTSPEGIRAQVIDSLYTAVPDGGDARFAAAVCGYDASVLRKMGLMWEDDELVAGTPHLLRASGRMVCGSIEGMTADDYLEETDEQADAARADPQKFVDDEVRKIETALAGMNDDATLSETARQLRTDFENSIRMLREQDPQAIADGLHMYREFQWLAVEHVCPRTSVLGFGQACGTVPSPLGHAPLTVRTHSGPVTCTEALDVVRRQNAGGYAATAPWTCEYNSDEDTSDQVMMYCFNGHARIVVPRRPA